MTRKRSKRSVSRQRRSRLRREAATEKYLVWGAIALALVVVALITYGIIDQEVLQAREPVAVVYGTPITTAQFQDRVRFERLQLRMQLQQYMQMQQSMAGSGQAQDGTATYIQQAIVGLRNRLAPESALQVGEQALDGLIREELVRQEAEERSISVSPDELQTEIELQFGYDREQANLPVATPPVTETETLTETAPVMPTPTPMTEADFQERYQAFIENNLQPLDVSESQFRSWIKASLLEQRLRDAMMAELPQEADQVKIRFLTVDDEARAQDLLGRLEAGEDFEALADEVEAAEEGFGIGSELQWYPQSLLEEVVGANLGEDTVERVFTMEAGERIGPIPNPDGTRFSVVEVVGHEERELTESHLSQLAADEFDAWLEARMVGVERMGLEEEIIPVSP